MKFHHIMMFFLMAVSISSTQAAAGQVSEVKADETLVFFNSSAWFNSKTGHWHIPIHGWIYEPEDSIVRKSMIESVFKKTYDLATTPETETNFSQRINQLLADNERGKSIIIRFANRTYAIKPSNKHGHFFQTLRVDASVISTAVAGNQLAYQAVLPEHDQRIFNGQVNLIAPKGLSIISDIDDTIKISAVGDRKQLLDHTFYQKFKAVSGMAEQYQQWLQPNGALHFVSSSPWQLYPALNEFIDQAGFPFADYALKTFRFKDSSLLNLFKKGIKTKPPQIINILKKYPDRQFILVGDSGEQDPEVYAQIQQQFSAQIVKILIRNVTNEKAKDQRFQSLYKNLDPQLWQLFDDVNEVTLNLN